MSGQWEVVGKSKKDKQSGKSKKLSKIEKQKFVDNAPKVEDLLPLAQVKTLYSALDTNKEVSKPIEKATKTKENEAKKAQKKQKEKKEPTVKETNNKPPKTIEAAIALITVAEVQSVLEVGQMRFSEAPLVWLKGLASWLNVKLPVDHTDNVYTAKSWEYPLCLLSVDIRAVLKKALKEVPDSAVQMFYDYCLTSMANDMTKGSPVTGYKMLLQLVASQYPSVAASNLAKASGLRHSYQNRPAIGCSVMWALGQAGFKDLPTGLQVWLNVMFPVLELRHYSQFVCDYLKHLLARHSTSKAVTAQLYFEVLDIITTSSNNTLYTHMNTLKAILNNSQSPDRLHNLFEPLLSRLDVNTSAALRDQLVRFLTQCLTEDAQTFAEWRQLYTKHLSQSAILLTHISSTKPEWGKNSRHLKDTLETFKVTNDDMIRNKQKAEGLQKCSQLCNDILSEMAESRSFPWKTLSFLFVLALAGMLAFDVKTHGSFKGSKSGIFLRDVGALKYGEQAATRVNEVWLQAYGWSKQNIPQYLATVWPYIITASDFVTLHTVNVVSAVKLFYLEKKPLIEQWVNQNLPGLQESMSSFLSETWKVGLQLGHMMFQYTLFVVEWFQKNVFVGNVQRLTLEALNSTQTAAAKALSWLVS